MSIALHEIQANLEKLSPTLSKDERKQLLETLANTLTIHEAGSLVAQINAKNNIAKAKRFGLYPIEDYGSFERMLELDASHWDANEIVFTADKNEFAALTKEEQNALLTCFAFFAVGDGTISSMIAYQMILVSKTFESQCYYAKQMAQEVVHGHVYGNMIQTLVVDPQQRDHIFKAIEDVPAIKAMNEYIENAFTFPDGERQLYIYLACAEYLMFTPLFCIIFWFRAYHQGKMQAVLESNEQIAKDEAAHCKNGCCKYNELPKGEKYSTKEIHEIVGRVVQLVSNLAHYMVIEQKINLEELTYENLVQYIQFVADDLLDRVHHAPLYNVSNPFPWMIYTQFERKANFYEAGSVMEYKHFNVKDKLKEAKELNDRFDIKLSQTQSTNPEKQIIHKNLNIKKAKF